LQLSFEFGKSIQCLNGSTNCNKSSAGWSGLILVISAVEGLKSEDFNSVLVFFCKFSLFPSSGDGRNDTPGHCAQYCSYSLMEKDTKKILTLKTIDKRMTDRKSGNMEKFGFQATMEELKEKGVTVAEVVTDAHLGIGALMSKSFEFKSNLL